LYDSDLNRRFVESFMNEYDRVPNQFAKDTWEAVHLYKKAVEQAGTTDFDPVVSAIEEVEIEGPVGPLSIRDCDHRCERPIHVGEVVDSEEYGEPVSEILRTVDGTTAMPPCEEMGCSF
jgi:branched-chain amino acid transport system substrate-binding protein